MALFGTGGLSPGDKWIRTEQGWKHSAEVHANLREQIAKNITLPSMTVRVARSRSRSNESRDFTPSSSTSSGSGSCSLSRSKASPGKASPRRKDRNIYFTNGFNENRLQLIQLSLAQRYILIRKSSKESSHYYTISDALSRMNFNGALLDTNCYPFICRVLTALFMGKYWAMSRSTHTTLLRLVDTAYEIALETGLHTRAIRDLIETAKNTLEEGRNGKVVMEFLITRVDSKIKILNIYQEQISRQMSKQWDDIPDGIHGDCWRIIISYLTDPRDVLNLGKINSQLHSITTEDAVWRCLTFYHYGNTMDDQTVLEEKSVGSKLQWLNIFKEKFMSWSVVELEQSFFHTDLPLSVSSSFSLIDSGPCSSVESRLPGLDRPAHAVALCQHCHSIFWKSYGHPCKTGLTAAGVSVCSSTDVHPSQTAARGLSPLEFLHLFHC